MPTTPRGKAVVSKNAHKHGIYSNKPPTTDDQDLGLYERVKAGLLAEFEPQTITEEIEIERITMARVRLQRLWRSEMARVQQQRLIDQKSKITPPKPDLFADIYGDNDPKVPPSIQKTIDDLEALIEDLSPDVSAIVYNENIQKRLQREEGHLNRIIDRGIKYLQQQQDRRNGFAPMTVEAIAKN